MRTRYIKKPYHIKGYLIESNSNELIEFLDQHFYPFIFNIFEDEEYLDIKVEIKGELSMFDVNNEKYDKPSDECVQEILNIIYSTSSVCDYILPIHAAAIAKNDNVFLFLGNTKAGKSTMITYLCKRWGYEYLTDDAIFFNKETLSIMNYYKPIMLRPDSINILKNNGVVLDDVINLKWGAVDRFLVKIDRPDTRNYKLAGILNISRGKANRVAKKQKSETFNLLLNSLLYAEKMSIGLLNCIKKLSYCDCYQLSYKDLSFVKEVIDEL